MSSKQTEEVPIFDISKTTAVGPYWKQYYAGHHQLPRTKLGWIGFGVFVWWFIAITWLIWSPTGVFPNSLTPYVFGMPMSWAWWMINNLINMVVSSLMLVFVITPKDHQG